MIVSAIDVYVSPENTEISPSLSSIFLSSLGKIFPQCRKDGPQRFQNFSSKLQKEMSSTFLIILQKIKRWIPLVERPFWNHCRTNEGHSLWLPGLCVHFLGDHKSQESRDSNLNVWYSHS